MIGVQPARRGHRSARDVLDRAKAGPAEIVTAVRQRRAASSAVIEAVHIETLIGANPTP